jgi:hypothetical protein
MKLQSQCLQGNNDTVSSGCVRPVKRRLFVQICVQSVCTGFLYVVIHRDQLFSLNLETDSRKISFEGHDTWRQIKIYLLISIIFYDFRPS